ncbi:MAG: ATP-binding cassette domain-containing protein [Candidatus Ryanbacteria bacterium]|nr:ATP-binding cassette domain-containing protein [Candidatus Ryanbacteria bacterium]
MKSIEADPFALEGSHYESLASSIEGRVVDLTPYWAGNSADRKSVQGALVAALNTFITRCDPPLKINGVAVEPGKSVVLVGPNGAGKSTLFDGLMDINNASLVKGSHGYNSGFHKEGNLRIARLNQEEIFAGMEDMQVESFLNQLLEHYKKQFPVDWDDPNAHEQNLSNQEAQLRIDELVGRAQQLFQIGQFKDRKVSELSGGERTKLALMMIFASEPDVILLDEPTNHLDLESIAKLTGLIEIYKRAGAGIVSVSHVDWYLDMVGADGTLDISINGAERLVTSSRSPYSKYKRREAHSTLFNRPLTWEADYSYPHKATSLFNARTERISIPDSPLKDFAPPTFNGQDIVIFSGQNGTGKTKLMEAMVERKHGIDGVKGLQTAYMPQFWPDNVAKGTVQDFFRWVKSSTNKHSEKSENRFLKQLRELGFEGAHRDILSQPPSSFSGGEQRMLWFATASIIEGTDLLILDEPTNHMDVETMKAIVEAIRNFPGGVILSTHDLRPMKELEQYQGPTRHGLSHVVFERENARSHLRETSERPSKYAEAVISQARKSAKRLRVA